MLPAPPYSFSTMAPEVILKAPPPIEDPDRVPEAARAQASVNVHVQLSAIAGTKPITTARTNIHAILRISTPFQASLSPNANPKVCQNTARAPSSVHACSGQVSP